MNGAPEPPVNPDRVAKITDYLSGLGYLKLRALFVRVGLEPSSEFYNCLCPRDHGYFYSPGPRGPCMRIGVLGGTSWAPFSTDRQRWDACLAAHGADLNAAVDRAIRAMYDAPPVDTPGVAGGTVDLNALPTPSGDGPFEHPLRSRFRELEAMCLPVPANVDELFFGPIISQTLRADLLAEVQALLEEPRSICDLAIEAKLLLDGERGRYLADLAIEAAWELWGVDSWTGYESVAKVSEALFCLGSNALSSRIGFLGLLSDLKSLAEMADTEYQAHVRNVWARDVFDEYRRSADWTNETLDVRVGDIEEEIAHLAQKINALQRELSLGLARLEPAPDLVGVVGGPFDPPGSKIPNSAPAWDNYRREANALVGEYEARIRQQVFEMTQLEMKGAVLRNYRRPLSTMTCAEFIESRQRLCRGRSE